MRHFGDVLTMTLTFDFLSWKLAHRLLMPRKTFTQFHMTFIILRLLN